MMVVMNDEIAIINKFFRNGVVVSLHVTTTMGGGWTSSTGGAVGYVWIVMPVISSMVKMGIA